MREETGVVAEPVRELGEARYWYRRDGRTIAKTVHVLPVRATSSGDTADHDDEVVEAALDRARARRERELSHAAEREMVGARAGLPASKDR